MNIKAVLNALYLEYLNDYLTVDKMAEHKGIKTKDLADLLKIGKAINNKEYEV